MKTRFESIALTSHLPLPPLILACPVLHGSCPTSLKLSSYSQVCYLQCPWDRFDFFPLQLCWDSVLSSVSWDILVRLLHCFVLRRFRLIINFSLLVFLLSRLSHVSCVTDAQTPVRCAANGHYYLSISSNSSIYSFSDALSTASSKWYNFNPGYLATITTDAERICVTGMMFKGGQWIGGVDNYSEGTFRWIDGPEAGMPITRYWDNNEPSGGTSENCIMLVSSGSFHDYFCTTLLPAFLVEFDDDVRDACM